MALGKPGRLRVDQPTITGELRPANSAQLRTRTPTIRP